MAEKSNSLLALGYTIEPQDAKDDKGLKIVAVIYKPLFVKETKRGKLKAFKSVNDTVETTVDGLYNFEFQGNDLVGKRPEPKPVASAPAEPVQATA